MVGVCYCPFGRNDTTTTNIFIFEVESGVTVCLHSIAGDSVIPLWGNVWPQGEFLRFVTVDKTSITIRGVGLTPGSAPMEVEDHLVPGGLDCNRTRAQLLPALNRLAFISRKEILVWDIRNSECLLRCTETRFHGPVSFSSDGRFFVCQTAGGQVYLWKEPPTGYNLHQIITSTGLPGRRIGVIYDGHVMQLWRTKGFTPPSSSVLIQAPRQDKDFVLDFSPDGMWAVVAKRTGKVVTVLNLKSGTPQLTIGASGNLGSICMRVNSPQSGRVGTDAFMLTSGSDALVAPVSDARKRIQKIGGWEPKIE